MLCNIRLVNRVFLVSRWASSPTHGQSAFTEEVRWFRFVVVVPVASQRGFSVGTEPDSWTVDWSVVLKCCGARVLNAWPPRTRSKIRIDGLMAHSVGKVRSRFVQLTSHRGMNSRFILTVMDLAKYFRRYLLPWSSLLTMNSRFIFESDSFGKVF